MLNYNANIMNMLTSKQHDILGVPFSSVKRYDNIEPRHIVRMIENALISAFSLKQPRKIAFDYNNNEYIVEVKRETYGKCNVTIQRFNELLDIWETLTDKAVTVDYAPQFVKNLLTM